MRIDAPPLASDDLKALVYEIAPETKIKVFEETGDVFDPALARRLHDYVYAAGNSRDPAEAYRAFRGALPGPDALLRQRGLLEAGSN